MSPKHLLIVIPIMFSILSCEHPTVKHELYEKQIGDTPFNKDLDVKEFQFCDSTNVLHKRAYVQYEGGTKALLEEFNDLFNLRTKRTNFNGYCIVRLAVNCNGVSGRFRVETLDSIFRPAKEETSLEADVLEISKRLEYWKKPYYRGKYYDGYTFFIIKFENGKIENDEL